MIAPWRPYDIYFLAILLTYFLLAISPARSHDDAAWIGQGHYRGADGSYCCGVNDCHRVTWEIVALVRDGYLVSWHGQRTRVPFSQSQRSKDADYWLCERPDHSVRCFFAPPMGS